MVQHQSDAELQEVEDLLYGLAPLANDRAIGTASVELLDLESVSVLHRAFGTNGVGTEDPAVDALLRAVLAAVEAANSNFFRFDIRGAIAPDEPRLIQMRYLESTRTQGLGLTAADSRRKLLAVVVLDIGRSSGVEIGLTNELSSVTVSATPGSVITTPAYCSLVLSTPGSILDVLAFHCFGPAFV